ncbi:MAG TPA: hypothetical protein VLQ79_01120 [Myxococcaceae bacterium]|nr:hypothetical protein [Myxococcaceae bacterium]
MNGWPHARFVVCERTARGWEAGHHKVTYDWEAAAETAGRHGRPEWAAWLRSGRV